MRKFAMILALLLMLLPAAAFAEQETAAPGETAAAAGSAADESSDASVEAEAAQSLAGLDISRLSLEELYALRDQINGRIELLEADGAPCYESGTYTVGTDIPAGVYLVLADEYGIFSSVMVHQGTTQDSPLESYELIINQAVIQLNAGTCVTLNDASAYPYDNAPEAGLVDGVGAEGGYWVGVQIPAGRYTIQADEKAPLSSYSIYSGILGTDPQLLRFELVYDPVEVDLETGQYIALSGCSVCAAE